MQAAQKIFRARIGFPAMIFLSSGHFQGRLAMFGRPVLTFWEVRKKRRRRSFKDV